MRGRGVHQVGAGCLRTLSQSWRAQLQLQALGKAFGILVSKLDWPAQTPRSELCGHAHSLTERYLVL
jgi:hypothetical protein